MDALPLHAPRQLNRFSRHVGVVGVDGELDIRAEEAPDRRHQFRIARYAEANLHLGGPKPLIQAVAGLALPAALQRFVAAKVEARPIALNGFHRRGAQQPIEGCVGVLRFEVPARDV